MQDLFSFSVSNLSAYADIVILVVLVLAMYRMFRLQSAIRVLKGSEKEMRETLIVLTDNVEKSMTGVRDILEESKQTALELGQRLAESDNLMQKADEWKERALEIDQAVAASESLLTELRIVRDSAERTADRLSDEARTVNTLLSSLRSEAAEKEPAETSRPAVEKPSPPAGEGDTHTQALTPAAATSQSPAEPKAAEVEVENAPVLTEVSNKEEGSPAFLIGASNRDKAPKLRSDGKWGNYAE